MTWDALDAGKYRDEADAAAARRYALTPGIHSRIDVVVGVQPFGGEGRSGAGPKAGGPQAPSRYAVERALSVNIAAQGGDPALLNL